MAAKWVSVREIHADGKYSACWNFAVPEVHEYVLRNLREVAERWPFGHEYLSWTNRSVRWTSKLATAFVDC